MAELTLSAGDIAAALKKNLEGFEPSLEARTVGRVTEVGDGIARVSGLPDCGVNELLEFEDGSVGLALNLDEESMGAVILGDADGVEEGQTVKATGRILSVPVGDKRRGLYLKWLFFGPSCVEPAITDRAYPRKEEARQGTLGHGDYDTVIEVLAKGVAGGPYLLGEQFTAADVVIGSGLRWGMMFKLIPERPEFTAYVGRLNERPALKRAQEKDAAASPPAKN